MIGRGGASARATVPWCPYVANHPLPELPGVAIKMMAIIANGCRSQGIHPRELQGLSGIFLFEMSLLVMLELEMFPAPEGS